MHLALIDLVPLLLSWEGAGPDEPPTVAAEAAEMLAEVYANFNIAGIADGDLTGLGLRRALEDAELDAWFDYVGTSAEFGPRVSPRVVRRLARVLGFDLDEVVVVTSRGALAEALQRSHLTVVHAEGPQAVAAVPEALAALYSGYFSP
jgi:hypothetical protein